MAPLSEADYQARLDNPNYVVIRHADEWPELKKAVGRVTQHTDYVGVDTETTGLNPRTDRVRLIQVASTEFCLIVDLDAFRVDGERQVDWSLPGLTDLGELLVGPTAKVFQNAAFDLNFLRGEGLLIGGDLFDTMIAAKIYNNGTGAKNDLGSIVQRTLNVKLPKELQKADWSGEITDEMLLYAARDAVCLCFLVPLQVTRLMKSKPDRRNSLFKIFELEMACIRPIAYMQWNGFGFNVEEAEQLKEQLQNEADAMRIAFLETLDAAIKEKNPDNPRIWLPRDPDGSFNTRERDSGSIRLGTKVYAGFNPRSPKQMAERFEQAGLILPPNSKGQASMDKNLLSFVRGTQPLVDAYMTWKACVTRVSCVEKLLDNVGPNSRIYGTYRQMGTDTGRLSAAEPNLQQVPREASFRRLFQATEGHTLVVADFSQVELRVAAQLSGEPRMQEAYLEGRDLHIETAALVTGKAPEDITKQERTSAKICNFGLLYGSGAATLRKQAVAQYGVDLTHEEAVKLVQGFRSAYPRLKAWQDEEGESTTKAVYTKMGRRRMLSGFNDKYTTRINTQVQGTAGDIAKLAISKLWDSGLDRASEDEAMLIAMVHDEIVLEVRTDLAELWSERLATAMESAGAEICTEVPIVAEASSGPTWADAK